MKKRSGKRRQQQQQSPCDEQGVALAAAATGLRFTRAQLRAAGKAFDRRIKLEGKRA